ncbi:geranylgeranylglycerol-phosphate geranylgeranyltransferase [Paraflavisolibacter sp. H34]|uniref:geranylgeranylglycerol-phosphate geranylgeranyltransferase n=1 Tax=Huijunlia imazamoxiresistens TaxID=3127457 RepID=UPI00301B3ADE
MSLIAAFLRLVRWPNLVFIVLTQFLFYFCVYLSLYQHPLWYQLLWLVGASVCIAAAGYIINDYFDLNIDQINKPGKNVLNSRLSRRWAIVWHLSLSVAGIVATAVAVSRDRWYLVLANIACVMLLWLYSTSFKRKLLIGNILISLLTAWSVLILFFAQVPLAAAFNNEDPLSVKFFRISFLYAGFAFLISIIREAIKDMEDVQGDEQYGCTTLPIYVGFRATKIYISVWVIVLVAALVILQLYVLQFGWYLAVGYSVVAVILPLLYSLSQLFKARTPEDYGRLSALTKWIMLAGILSMLFFRLYF